MKKALLTVNPGAGGEKATEYEAIAKTKLESFFDEVVVRYTEKSGDAAEFSARAAADGYHSVFVMGGDGTVNEGISGLAEQPHRPAFGFFPLGTVNDLARALNIPLDPEKAIEQLDFFRLKPLDIGKINDKYFMNVVAAGTIPEAINEVESEEKTKWGKMAYFISGLKHLISTRPYRFRLTIDGEAREIESSTLLICSTNSVGGFEQLLPEARADDGLLHLVYLKDRSLADTIMAVPELLTGVESSGNNVEYLTFKEAKIELTDPADSLRINADGDEGDPLPAEIRILPGHLRAYCGPSGETGAPEEGTEAPSAGKT